MSDEARISGLTVVYGTAGLVALFVALADVLPWFGSLLFAVLGLAVLGLAWLCAGEVASGQEREGERTGPDDNRR